MSWEVLAWEESGAVLTQDVSIPMETVAADGSLGTDGVCVDGAEPRLGDAIGHDDSAPVPLGGCLDMVVCSPSLSLPEGTTPSDAVPAPESLSVVDLKVAYLELSGYPDTLSPPICWRQAEGSM
jgi:hypothetical protein